MALVLACAAGLAAPSALAQSRSGFEYNGLVHVSWWINEYNNFDQPTGAGTDSRIAMAATRASWAGLLVTWYQNDAQGSVTSPTQPGIIFRRPAPHIQNEEPKTPSDAALRFAIRELKARGLKVMLKPHVDAVNNAWRGEFNPTNVDGWFQSYTSFITHYAQMAQEEGVEAFVMGTEFRALSGAANRNRWIAVINAVRSRYSGVVTYAANATFPGDEFTSVSFWDQVDVIGLDAYFNLTDSNSPTQAQLVAAWTSNRFGENAVANVRNLANAHQKPLIFTELGYKSTDGANREPWNFGLSGGVDQGEQRDCYEAAFTVWSQQSSWMRGIMWWAWPVPAPQANDGDYNPRGKLAEQSLRDWQGTTTAGFTLGASPASLSVNRGASGTVAVSITRTGGFTGAVGLSASGLPAGVTASFSPASATGNTSTLTLTASATAATGAATVTITGTGGGMTRTATVGLTVNGPGLALAANPAALSVARGTSGASTLTLTRTGGFTSSVAFSASGLPAGVTASFSPASTTGNTSTLTLAASATAATGTANVTVTATGGGLTRSAAIALTVSGGPDLGILASPGTLSIARGASGTSTLTLARSGGFTGSVAFSTGSLPAGVTASFSPASTTGNTSTLTLTASATAATGTANVTVTATGAGLIRNTTIALTVTTGGGETGGVTVTPVVSASGPWFNEEAIRLGNTGTLTALSVTIVIQRTTGVGFSGQYNTVGGQIQQSNSSTAATVTYQFTLAPGQTLGAGTNRLFAAQASGSGTAHPTAGDTYTVTYTTGGTTYTQSGHF